MNEARRRKVKAIADGMGRRGTVGQDVVLELLEALEAAELTLIDERAKAAKEIAMLEADAALMLAAPGKIEKDRQTAIQVLMDRLEAASGARDRNLKRWDAAVDRLSIEADKRNAVLDQLIEARRERDDARALLTMATQPASVRETVLAEASATVRRVFKSKEVGDILGCFVDSGTVKRGSRFWVVRDTTQVWQGTAAKLRRFKHDVSEVRENFEFGLVLGDGADVHEGDRLVFFGTHNEMPDETKALLNLLEYGRHKDGCDRSNEKGEPDKQHECCSCGWCQASDWAQMGLLEHRIREAGKERKAAQGDGA